MRLKDVAAIKVNFPNADFWLERRGSIDTVGRPTKEFGPERIGIKIREEYLDRIFPNFFYYWFLNAYNNEIWKPFAKGALKLVHISLDDVKNLPIEFE